MAAAVRLGDLSTGHDCHPPVTANQGSDDVFVNGRPLHRVGDTWNPHACGGPPHVPVSVEGSSSVFINGKPAVRVGDMSDCGQAAAEGSDNVFIGG